MLDFQDPIILPRCTAGMLGFYIDEMLFVAERYGKCTGTFNGVTPNAVKGQSKEDIGRPYFEKRS